METVRVAYTARLNNGRKQPHWEGGKRGQGCMLVRGRGPTDGGRGREDQELISLQRKYTGGLITSH